ncbi:MAG: PAS domain S-box-containing protein [Parasphingorhabdus sp.]|jgi:PAS domain S-box-containing protein
MLDGMVSSNLALNDANWRGSLATESAEIGIWEYDHKSCSMYWADWAYRIYGISEKNQTEPFQAWQTLVHPDDIDATRSGNQGGDGEYNSEFRIIRPDGKVRWIKSYATNINDDHGNLLKLIGVNQDITEHKQAEEKLYPSEQILSSLVHS